MHKLHDQKDLPEIPPLRYLTAPDGEGRVLITPQTYDRLVELAGEPQVDSSESTRDMAVTVAEMALGSVPDVSPPPGHELTHTVVDDTTDDEAAETDSPVVEVEEVEEEAPPPGTESPEPSDDDVPGLCAVPDCDKDLANENPNYVQFSKIRFRKEYCEEHYHAFTEAQA